MTTNKRHAGRAIRNMLRAERQIQAIETGRLDIAPLHLRRKMTDQAHAANHLGVSWGRILKAGK